MHIIIIKSTKRTSLSNHSKQNATTDYFDLHTLRRISTSPSDHMASKKPTPVEHPTPAEPSSDEEEEEEEESDESEEEEALQPTPPPQPKPSKITIKKSDPKPASPDTGSDSEATPAPDLSKTVTLAIPAPATIVKSAKKRPADIKDYAKNFKKLKDLGDGKKTEEEEVKRVVEDSKKQLFQRLFSEDDEIELLKGMLKYMAEKGVDPAEDLNGFHQYVKSAIHVDVTNAQLSDKIRRLKKKFKKNMNWKSKTGVERAFSKPFGQLSYDLSKKIWGVGIGNAKTDVKTAVVEKAASTNGGLDVKANGKGKRTPKPNMTPDQKEKHASSLQISLPAKIEKERVCLDGSLPLSLCLTEVIKSKDAAGMGLREEFFKKGLDLLGDDVKAMLEEKWKGLVVAEAELYYKRLELTREHVKLTLDASKSR